jgi:hypothetical protein
MQYDLPQQIAAIKAQLKALATQPILLNASTGQDGGKGLTTDKDGLHVFNPSGVEVARLETSDGALVMFDATNTEIARYGLLTHTAAGSYGAEVLVSGTWVQLGAQTTTWGSITKPSTYNTGNDKWAPDAHTHPGGDITSQVAAAAQADGSQYGWTNNVAGTEFYALWVGNDGGYHFGRNTSSIRYKQNVRAHNIDPDRVLALQPVLFDRIPSAPMLAATNEFGLIAEQVAETFPELVSWFEGEIDSVRYDLLAVGLLSVAKRQQTELAAITAWATANGYTPPAPDTYPDPTPASGAPAVQPTPLPYTIQPQESS